MKETIRIIADNHSHYFLAVDDLEHHLVDPFDHALSVALEAGLDAGVVEQLPHDEVGVLGRFLPELVELDNQVVILIVLESQIPEFHPRLAGLY